MSKRNRYFPEVKERAVRMVLAAGIVVPAEPTTWGAVKAEYSGKVE
jgi:hypothetical protein